MNKSDRYAEREWLRPVEKRAAFEPYGSGPKAPASDVIEWPGNIDVNETSVEHVTMWTDPAGRARHSNVFKPAPGDMVEPSPELVAVG